MRNYRTPRKTASTQRQESWPASLESNPLQLEKIKTLLHTLFFIAILLLFVVFGAYIFATVSAANVAAQFYARNPLLQIVPSWIIYLLDWHNLRFAIAPLAAIIAVLLAGMAYVQDIYALEEMKDASGYVMASMFGADYPSLVIDGGRRQVPPDNTHLLDAIGGPGFVMIQPGSAVVFKKLRSTSRASVTRSYFLAPFEMIAQIASLEDQHGYVESLQAMTRDGIKVVVRNLNYRFRILPEMKDGKPVQRSLEKPYPYSEEAMQNMTYNLWVAAEGLDPWPDAVRRMVVGRIKEYIVTNNLDYLTAPREEGQDPRGSLRDAVFSGDLRARLASIGAELQWIDVGHFDIEDNKVDSVRVDMWAAEWLGNAKVARAFGEARLQAYQELGRAEAQAELIVSITQAMEGIPISGDSVQSIKNILMARTAQLLDALKPEASPD
ncbi:MAG: hypothetical protein ABSE06_04670 [Anaerolineaceae bacterium]|jgi:hypothetical protein